MTVISSSSRMSARSRSTERRASSIFSPLIEPEVSRTTASEIGARPTVSVRVSVRTSATTRTSANTVVSWPESTRVWLSEIMPWTPGPANAAEFFPFARTLGPRAKLESPGNAAAGAR